jgi:hypothetical protein
MTILHKPVGSGVSPKGGRASDPLLIWTAESPKSTGSAHDREIKQQTYARSYDSGNGRQHQQARMQHADLLQQPSWEMQDNHSRPSSVSGACRGDGQRASNGSPSKSTGSEPRVRFQSNTVPEPGLMDESESESESVAMMHGAGLLRKRNAHARTPLRTSRKRQFLPHNAPFATQDSR